VRNEEGHKQYMVKLRISRLAKLIGNQELIAEYRSQPDADDAATRCALWREGRMMHTACCASLARLC
jgi:hypothetical protein